MTNDELNGLTREIIGAVIEVHRILGTGIFEENYKYALAHELTLRGLNVKTEVPITFHYKGLEMPNCYRSDIVVEDEVILELKATNKGKELFAQQLLTYLRLTNKRIGLVINFNAARLIDGIERVVNNF